MQPITEALTEADATILRNTEATQLCYERDHISGVLLRDGTLLQADWYIAALPPQQLTPLLPERWLTRFAYFQQLAELVSFDSTILHVHAEQPCATLASSCWVTHHFTRYSPQRHRPIAHAYLSSRPTVSTCRRNLTLTLID